LGDRVIDQTQRRVLHGEQVPAEEKVFSIFESHTDLIKRGKARKPVEFGHKVFLAESAQGLITDYQVLEGNPADTTQVRASLERHERLFQGPPIYMPRTEAFTVPKMRSSVGRREYAKYASRSAVGRRPPSGKPWRAARCSKRASVSARALRAASRCCFGAAE
jgi:hypothetical protein